MKVLLGQSALDDLRDIKAYYVEVGAPKVGGEIVTDILRHVDILIDHPMSGRIVPEFETENIRELIYPPYRVVYTIQASDLILIRVWRSERMLQLPD